MIRCIHNFYSIVSELKVYSQVVLLYIPLFMFSKTILHQRSVNVKYKVELMKPYEFDWTQQLQSIPIFGIHIMK